MPEQGEESGERGGGLMEENGETRKGRQQGRKMKRWKEENGCGESVTGSVDV